MTNPIHVNPEPQNDDLPIKKEPVPAFVKDRELYRNALYFIGITSICGTLGIFYLSMIDKPRDALVAITTASIAGLISLFERQSKKKS